MAKKLLVKDALEFFNDSEKVCCMFFAYGSYYADTVSDKMQTAKECKEQLNYDCKHAMVTFITKDDNYIIIHGEIVH